jgi:type II secretory pathway predicted ATPase ExeA
MLSQYFGFKQEPFGATPDPRCFYPSHTHNEALASLKYGFLSNRGFTAMIAPPGLGKTTLLLRFLEEIRESARSVFLFDIDADCEPRDFIAYILRDIGIGPAQRSSEMHEQLTMALVTETRAGRKFVVVIDEAQNLSDAVLERVRLLTNFETSSGKLLQIVLSGQPQLTDKLMQASLVQLRQRISTICHIDPLTAEETVAYIDYRLKQAGYDGERLFKDDALKLVSETSQGTPRIINNLCYNSLSLCRAVNRKQVDRSMVSEVIADLQLTPQSREPIAVAGEVTQEQPREPEDGTQMRHLLGRWVLASATLLGLCVLGVQGFIELRTHQSQKPSDNHSLNQGAVPASVPARSAESLGKTIVTEHAPNTSSFEITVEPDQTLQEISVQYLGGFDLQRLHKIQKLNPELTDPNLIIAGQMLRLPGPPSAPSAKSTTPPTKIRKLP